MMADQDALSQAEKLKEEGNQHYRSSRFEEALDCYSEAIRLAPEGSHVYYSNRCVHYPKRPRGRPWWGGT
jgi:tetratricopeptide (TPR) repeat protein